MCVSAVGGLLCSTLAGSLCTLCCAVDQLSVSHVLTGSVTQQARKDQLISILEQKNVQTRKHDRSQFPIMIHVDNSYYDDNYDFDTLCITLCILRTCIIIVLL